jgi:hypothetical protein
MFGFALAPLLVGAGVGALGGLLAGKDPLKGALMGGVTGGLLGPLSGTIGAGGVGAGAASASSAGATGLVGAGNAALGSGIGAGLGGGLGGGAGSYVAGGNPAAFLAPTGQEIGMSNAFNLATNAPINVASSAVPTTGSIMGEMGGANLTGAGLAPNVTSMQDFAASQMYGANNAMLNDPVLGGINPLSSSDYEKIAAMPAESSSSFFGDIYDKVKPYVDVRDIGSTALKSQLQSQPRQQISPQSGQVTRGQAPQGNDVMALLQSMKMPERRRITLI